MGRQASTAAAQAGRTRELHQPPDTPGAQAMPVRTRSAARAPAPAPARQPLTPPGQRRPASRNASEPGRYASAELAPQPAAPGRARRLTRDWLNRWDMAALTDAAVAIASELTANAVAAVPPGTTGLSVIIAIHATPSGLRISAWDIGPGHPQPAHAGPDAETGRGLTLIHALTEGNWGWWPTPASGGKVTWATLTAPEPPAGYIP